MRHDRHPTLRALPIIIVDALAGLLMLNRRPALGKHLGSGWVCGGLSDAASDRVCSPCTYSTMHSLRCVRCAMLHARWDGAVCESHPRYMQYTADGVVNY